MCDLRGLCAVGAAFWITASVIVAAIIIAVFGFARYAYNVAFYAPKRKRDLELHRLPMGAEYGEPDGMFDLIDELAAVPCERISATARDGLKLDGRFYKGDDGAPFQIQFNGYRGLPLRDMAGGCKLARQSGQNVILATQRAHEESDGDTITFGIREKYDVIAWINCAIERFGKDIKIILSGVSMGAATVLEASGLDLPANVVGIIADSPYSSPEEILAKTCKKMGYPVWLTMPFIKLGAMVYGHFRVAGGAEEAVKNSKVPILIIHGEADTFVPCEMSRKIYAACASEKYLYTCPGADHGISYVVDTEKYVSVVRDFLEKIL